MKVPRTTRMGAIGLAIGLALAMEAGIPPAFAGAPSHVGAVKGESWSYSKSPLNARDLRDIKLYTSWVLDDIATLDEYVLDGIGMPSALTNLAGSYRDLLGTAVPPRANAASYKANLSTLADFASQAAAEFSAGDEAAGSARYEVIRKKTSIILKMINKGLGTKYRLPTASNTAGSASNTTTSASDAADIKRYAGRVLEDIAALDIYVLDGIGLPARLSALSKNYTDLLNSAVPTGADAANYKARCQTLANFAKMAADDYSIGDSMNGRARYSVIRQETIPLLNIINKGLSTTYALA